MQQHEWRPISGPAIGDPKSQNADLLEAMLRRRGLFPAQDRVILHRGPQPEIAERLDVSRVVEALRRDEVVDAVEAPDVKIR